MGDYFKKIIKIFLLIVLGIVIFNLGGEIGYRSKYYIDQWRFTRALEKFNQGIIDYFKNDTYGGKTPQETYQMFISALKAGDLDSASKYFYWEKQVGEKERLEKLKTEGKLEEYIENLPKWEDLKEEEYWDKDGRRYVYEIYEKSHVEKLPDGKGGYIEKKWPAGQYKYSITFWLNKHAQIWKIYSL